MVQPKIKSRNKTKKIRTITRYAEGLFTDKHKQVDTADQKAKYLATGEMD